MTPDEWRTVRFKEIADYRTGRTPARARQEYWHRDSASVPWVTISDMRQFGTITETKEQISEAAFRQVFGGKAVRAGTLLMSFKLTIGRVATLGIDACHNEAIIAIYPRDGVNQRFLGYSLSQIDYDTLKDRQVKGNTLNQEKINRISILLPPTDEQILIADTLDFLRRAIRLQEVATKTTQDLRRTALRALFTHGLRGEAQKETEAGHVPESWALTPLERVFKLTSGTTRPNDLVDVPAPENPYPVIGGNGVMGYSGSWNTDAPATLIIGRVGEYCGAVHVANGKAWITDNALFAKEWLLPEADLQFVARFLEYFDLNRFKRMAGQPLVTQGMINEHFIPLPGPDEQKEIVAIFDAIDCKLELHCRKRTVLEDLFKALQRQLMTRELRVADLDLSVLDAKLLPETAA